MKRFAKFAPLGAIALAAVIAAAPQDVSALSFTYKGQKNGSATVQYTRTAPPGLTEKKGNSSAGIFSMEDETPGGLGEFLAWCFDVDTNISTGPHTYTENANLLDTTPPYLAGAKERVQKLFDRWYDPEIILGDNAKSAGFQIAIWEVLYDDNYDITDGSFEVTGGDEDARNEATTFLSEVEDYSGSQKWVITTYAAGTSSQDLGVATAIPLPAAAWLLLGVSGALVAAKRRSARKAT